RGSRPGSAPEDSFCVASANTGGENDKSPLLICCTLLRHLTFGCGMQRISMNRACGVIGCWRCSPYGECVCSSQRCANSASATPSVRLILHPSHSLYQIAP